VKRIVLAGVVILISFLFMYRQSIASDSTIVEFEADKVVSTEFHSLVPSADIGGNVEMCLERSELDMLKHFGVLYKVVTSGTDLIDRTLTSSLRDGLVAASYIDPVALEQTKTGLLGAKVRKYKKSGSAYVYAFSCREYIDEIGMQVTGIVDGEVSAMIYINGDYIFVPRLRDGIPRVGLFGFNHDLLSNDPILVALNKPVHELTLWASFDRDEPKYDRDCIDIWWVGNQDGETHCFGSGNVTLRAGKSGNPGYIKAWVKEDDPFADDTVYDALYIYCDEPAYGNYYGSKNITVLPGTGDQDCESDVWVYFAKCDKSGGSDPGTYPMLHRKDCQAPSAPQPSAPYDGYHTCSRRVTLSCNSVSDNSAPPCNVEYKFVIEGGSDSGWRTSRSWQTPNLSPGHTYYWRIYARDAIGNISSYSRRRFTIDSEVVHPGEPISPSNGHAYCANDDVTFRWDAGSASCPGLASSPYRIWIDDNSSFSSPWRSSWQSSRSITKTIGSSPLNFSGSHRSFYWKIETRNEDGHSEFSGTRRIDCYRVQTNRAVWSTSNNCGSGSMNMLTVEAGTHVYLILTGDNFDQCDTPGTITAHVRETDAKELDPFDISMHRVSDGCYRASWVAVWEPDGGIMHIDDDPEYKYDVSVAGEAETSGKLKVTDNTAPQVTIDRLWFDYNSNDNPKVFIRYSSIDNGVIKRARITLRYRSDPSESPITVNSPIIDICPDNDCHEVSRTDAINVNFYPDAGDSLCAWVEIWDYKGNTGTNSLCKITGGDELPVDDILAISSDGSGVDLRFSIMGYSSDYRWRLLRMSDDGDKRVIAEGTVRPYENITARDDLGGVMPGTSLVYELLVIDGMGAMTTVARNEYEYLGVDVRSTAIVSCQPNPFNPITTVVFNVDSPGYVQVQIYDLNGRMIRTLCNEVMGRGQHTVQWDGKNSRGMSVSSGVYFVRLSTSTTSDVKKVVLLE